MPPGEEMLSYGCASIPAGSGDPAYIAAINTTCGRVGGVSVIRESHKLRNETRKHHMNPQTHPRAAKLRRMLLVIALVVCPLLAPESGRAQAPVVTATLTGSNGSSTVNITSNQSFTLTLMINTNFPSSGITFFFRSNAAGSGLFRITARDATGSPYVFPPLVCSPGDPCLLNPVNDFDLGGSNVPDPLPPGSYTVATFTFETLNAPIGQYTISTDRGIVTDRSGGGFVDRPFTATATINVVPEPGTVGLALLGGGALLVAAWRRQRRQM